MHVFLVFYGFLFVGESYYSVIDKCCCVCLTRFVSWYHSLTNAVTLW